MLKMDMFSADLLVCSRSEDYYSMEAVSCNIIMKASERVDE